MPTVEFFFKGRNSAQVSGDAVVVNGALKLRRTDSDGNFDRAGTFKSGVATFPVRSIRELGEFFSFEVTDVGEGNVNWQISGDGGVTFLWHDGAYWVEALYPLDMNTTEEIARNINTFPLDFGRDFVLKAFLDGTPDGAKTPIIPEVDIHLEYQSFEFLEAVKRSFRRLFVDKLKVHEEEITAPLSTAADSVTLRTEYETVTEVVAVYNLTLDPNRGNDIFDSMTGPKTVRMVTAQPPGSFIEVQFKARPRILLSTDPDYPDTGQSVLPVIVIETFNTTEQRDKRVGRKRIERNVVTKKGRIREYFVKEEVSVRVRCASSQELQTSRMATAVGRVLQYFRRIPNIDTGEFLDVIDYSPITDNDLIRQELREKDIVLSIVGRNWTTPEFEEVPLAEKIVFGVGSLDQKFDDAILEP